MNLYSLIKPVLFKVDPEVVHDSSIHLMELAPQLARLIGSPPPLSHSIQIGKNRWSSPVGLAAGFDKNAKAFEFLSQLGFGHLELGTVTLNEQVGNIKPRIFRHPEELSLRNALGFPSEGLQQFKSNLVQHKSHIPFSINIGKNKESSPLEAIDEYVKLYEALAPLTNQITVNISSPNTPGLRNLGNEWLKDLFKALEPLRKKSSCDLFLKISPDSKNEDLKEWLCLSQNFQLNGIIATNTTTSHTWGPGGVSGKYLKSYASKIWQDCLKQRHEHFEIIAVGGFSNFEEMLDLWENGGKALEIYTSFIFQGPAILKNINTKISHFLETSRLKTLSDFFSIPISERKKIIQFYRTSKI